MRCLYQPQTAFIMAALFLFILILIAIVVRAIRKPDHDDYFDKPENWGDR